MTEETKSHNQLWGKKLPYTPYLSEELIYLNDIRGEISKGSEVGKLLRWYKNELEKH